jgi:2-keto-4-pentenoate hydratase/2-oxohepta-3-ene-1,7-dioic acid hydratase in catechol pathway
MKLLSFSHAGRQSFGALTDHGVVDLGSAECKTLRDLLPILCIDELERTVRNAPRAIELGTISYLQPVTNPNKILCVGINYRAHATEMSREGPRWPSLFVRFSQSQVGHLESVVRPAASEQLDYEGELAVIIGERARNVAVNDALRYVAGYSCFAENSVRDFQKHSTQATAGKNFRSSGAFGPWMVTADEIGDPSDLIVTSRINGTVMQRGHVAEMIFPIPELIAYISSFTDLLPGDVIATGTPDGVGASRQPPRWLCAGDVLEVEISGIGILRNSVIEEELM